MLNRKITIGIFMAAMVAAAIPPAYHLARGNLVPREFPAQMKADAVMVFSGASERISHGYRAYLEGAAEKIMVTGDDFPQQALEPEVRELSKHIRRDDINVDLEATNTIENAEHAAEWATKQDVESMVLITSEDHMPRAYFELRRLLPDDIELYAEAVPGDLHYEGIDSEKGRLICRMYETMTDTSFCYKAREFARFMGL